MNIKINSSIKQCLEQARALLSSPKSESDADTAKLDAEVLLAFVLNKPRSYLYTWPEQIVDTEQADQFKEALQRRYCGEPIAYITGVKEFWGLPLKVTPATLIPRPETERLVEIALQYIPRDGTCHVADLGTGSGAIALAIASERPNATLEASDISEAALAVANANLSSLALNNVLLTQGAWFECFTDQKFNFVLSNPPYVEEQDPHLQQGDLRFEPQTALSSGNDGLGDIRTIIESAKGFLSDGAYLLLEHGFDQAEAVIDLFEKSGYSEVQCYRDYGARERATIGRWLK